MRNTDEVAVLGTTSWGTTLAIILARKGMEVKLLARTEEEARKLTRERENIARLPGFQFPSGLTVISTPGEALDSAGMLILAVPSQNMRQNIRAIREFLDDSVLVLNVAKGLEMETARRMSEVIIEEIGPSLARTVCVLSGPNLSKEIAGGLPAATVVAGTDSVVASTVQRIMATPQFRVYVNSDLVGVELGGVLKNIIALAAGMVDGLGYGDNAKASLITRGLAEITRLGVAAGARPLTFAGLSGLGDIVATCASPLSRNRFVGQELARGRPLTKILACMSGVAEGVTTAVAAARMARQYNVEMPIAEQVHRVLYEGLDVRKAVGELMIRELKDEFGDIQSSATDHS